MCIDGFGRDKEIPREAIATLAHIRNVLEQSALAVYLFGSAAAGCLRPDSDVDMLVLVNNPLPDELRTRLVTGLLQISGRAGNRNSVRPVELTVVLQCDVVPWRYPAKKELVYGEWLRDELETGRIPMPAYDPDLAILLRQVRESSVSLFGAYASEMFDPVPDSDLRRAIRDSLPGLIDSIKGDERNVLLTLARMWLTAATGEIASKDRAAEWAAARLPHEQAALLDQARQAYLGRRHDVCEGRQPGLSALIADLRKAIESCGKV